MKLSLIFVQTYFRIASFLFPGFTANKAFVFFQKVRNKAFRNREQDFYKTAKSFRVPNHPENVFGYELGNSNGKEVFLVHGWDSNPGSMSRIAFALSTAGYRVLAMNLPGHGEARKNSTNLFEAKEGFRKFIEYVDPKDGFHCITHSFGSAVVSYALSEIDRKVDQLVFLTSPNKISVIFEEFKEGVQLGDKAFNIFCDMATEVLGEEVRKLSVSDKLNNAQFQNLSIIHDENDKVISIKNSKEIKLGHPDLDLIVFTDIGHYRMLWNDEVVILTTSLLLKS